MKKTLRNQKTKNKIIISLVFIISLLISFVTGFAIINKLNYSTSKTITITNKSSVPTHIQIPKLHISERIYNKATKQLLNKGICETNGPLTLKRPYILAGHNMVYGNRFFTTLPKIQKDDIILIDTNHKHYQYKVLYKQYLTNTKSNYKILKQLNPRYLILYTCTSSNNNNYRLCVTARLNKKS